MKTREPLRPEFGISKTLEAFREPPCPPPRGNEILERFFGVLHSQTKNSRDVNAAALTVADEMDDLWQKGDSRIPRNRVQTMKKKVMDIRDLLRYLSNKSKKGRPAYAEKVRFIAHLNFMRLKVHNI